MTPPGGPRDVRERVSELLRTHHVMTIAIHDADGPWAAAVFYAERFDARQRPQLVFVSSPNSRHVRALAGDPRAAATLHAECREWQRIRGLQLAGTVRTLAGDEASQARLAYAAKFPAIGDPAHAPEPLARAFAQARWYVLVPERAWLIDNAVSFGAREEIAYAAHAADATDDPGD